MLYICIFSNKFDLNRAIRVCFTLSYSSGAVFTTLNFLLNLQMAQQARVFAPGRPFLYNIMFLSKDGANLSEANLMCFNQGIAGVACKVEATYTRTIDYDETLYLIMAISLKCIDRTQFMGRVFTTLYFNCNLKMDPIS
jgi:hypothetical protein